MDTFRAGSNVDSWCTKCKLVLAHTIEAVASDKIKRVVCNTCGGKHQFKANKPGTTVKVARLKGVKPRSKVMDYTSLLGKMDFGCAKTYNFSVAFAKGDLINHPKFGFGVVTFERDVQKIEVLFESGPKILVHARV